MALVYDDFDSGGVSTPLEGRVMPTGQPWGIEQQRPDFQTMLNGDGTLTLTYYNTGYPSIWPVIDVPLTRVRVDLAAPLDWPNAAYHLGVRATNNAPVQVRHYGSYLQLYVAHEAVSQVSNPPMPQSSWELSYDPTTGLTQVRIDEALIVSVTATPLQRERILGVYGTGTGAYFTAGTFSQKLERFEATDTMPPVPPSGWQWTVRRVIDQ